MPTEGLTLFIFYLFPFLFAVPLLAWYHGSGAVFVYRVLSYF